MDFVFHEAKKEEEMRNNSHNILGEFVNHLDLLNTIGGGMAMTNVSAHENGSNLIIKLKTPCMEAENYHVEIVENVLRVFSTLNTESAEGTTKTPFFVRGFPIPYYVNSEKIEAVFDDKELKIFLPYNEKFKAAPKVVEIKQL